MPQISPMNWLSLLFIYVILLYMSMALGPLYSKCHVTPKLSTKDKGMEW